MNDIPNELTNTHFTWYVDGTTLPVEVFGSNKIEDESGKYFAKILLSLNVHNSVYIRDKPFRYQLFRVLISVIALYLLKKLAPVYPVTGLTFAQQTLSIQNIFQKIAKWRSKIAITTICDRINSHWKFILEPERIC